MGDKVLTIAEWAELYHILKFITLVTGEELPALEPNLYGKR